MPAAPTPRPSDEAAIEQAVLDELLARRDPVTFDELLALVARRPDIHLDAEGENLVDLAVEALWPIVDLPGDRVAHVASILHGTALTHRLTDDELAFGYLQLDPDLHLVERLFPEDDGPLALDGGGSLTLVTAGPDDDLLREHGLTDAAIATLTDSSRAFVLLLDGVDLGLSKAGDAVAIRVDADGPAPIVTLARSVDDPALVPRPVDDDQLDRFQSALLAAFEQASAIDELEGLQGYEPPDDDAPPAPVPLDDVLLQLIVNERELFAPGAPPLGELLEQLPWDVHGDFLAPAGTDWASWGRTMDVIAASAPFNLDPEQTVALGVLLQAFDEITALRLEPSSDAATAGGSGAVAPGTESYEQHLARLQPDELPAPVRAAVDQAYPAERRRELAQLLAVPSVGEAFATETMRLDLEPAPNVEAFAHLLLDASPPRGPRRAAAAWLLARALDRQGFAAQAAERLDEALAADGSLEVVLTDAAHLASDRGDAVAATRLADRAGLSPEDPWVAMLHAMIPADRADVGRNDPCWCGSGRKHKQCHLGRGNTPIEERADWLWHKGADFMQNGPWREELIDVTLAFLGRDELDMDVMLFAMREAVVSDLVLFESGAWEDFIAQRGVLLPDDEQVLAQEWARVPRSLFEVVEVDRGRSATVRDLRADTVVEVPSRFASSDLPVGSLLLAHVVPAGHAHAFVGGIVPVSLAMRDPLLELLDTQPDGPTLAALLGGFLGAPAQITNTEGEDLLLCETTYRVPDPAAVVAALDAHDALRLRRADEPRGPADPVDPDDPDARWVEEIELNGRDWIRGTLELRGDQLSIEANSAPRAERLAALIETIAPGSEVVHDQRVPADEMIESARRGTTRATTPLGGAPSGLEEG